MVHLESNTCRIPLSTLHLPSQEGGLGLLDSRAKFHILFFNRCIQLPKRQVCLHGHMFCIMLCVLLNCQSTRHKCFVKMTAVHLPVFPRDVLIDTGDHGIVRTRISEPFIYPFRSLQATPFPIKIMVPKLTTARNVAWNNLGHTLLDI
jgi:hypothetical protein